MWDPTRVEVTFHASMSVELVHVILKKTTRTRTLKGGGFGLTPSSRIEMGGYELTIDKLFVTLKLTLPNL